jgi:hypothetical protein
MIHVASRSNTNIKRKLLSLAFQGMKERIVSIPYEGDVADSAHSGTLNPNRPVT